MRFVQVDVFADGAYLGNPLAVFPEAGDLVTTQMQAIAREMNLSETSFVRSHTPDSYDVRIFTPSEELPFAGHPTLGTAWVLQRLGMVKQLRVLQHSRAGSTWVWARGHEMWFERMGTVSMDLRKTNLDINERLAAAFGADPSVIGLEARELGRPGRLEAAFADAAGFEQLMVPIANEAALRALDPSPARLAQVAGSGAYCFTAQGAGRIKARGFFPGVGVAEDAATGSAAAALGLYLADRLGPIEFEIAQGAEVGRPSRLLVKGDLDRVEVGGRCVQVFEAELQTLPGESGEL